MMRISHPEIESVRKEIAGIDESILHLVARRLELAERIGEIKRSNRLPIRDYTVEREVLERTREISLRTGMPPEIGEELMKLLIRSAVRTQEEGYPALDEGTRVLVVGGSGAMGTWLCDFFASRGCIVESHDPRPGRYPQVPMDRALSADTVILSTPISETPRILRRLIDMRPDGLVFDVCSLKGPLVPLIREGLEKGLTLSSVHPMFGPSAVLLSGRVLLICRCRSGEDRGSEKVREVFSGTALTLADVPLEEHDALVAYVLGLTHFINIAYAHALASSGLEFTRLHRCRSTTFTKQVNTSVEVVNENPDLYFDIQSMEPHTHRVIDTFTQSLQGLRRVVSRNDEVHRREFTALIRRTRDYFSTYEPGALEV